MFYGWRIVSGSVMANFVTSGFFTYAFSLLIVPLREEFDASLQSVMYANMSAAVFGLLLLPVGGILIDRFSARWTMTGGGVVATFGLWYMSRTSSIVEFNLAFGLTAGVAMAFMGPVSTSAVVTRWFTRNRGKALGITAMGTSFGGILMPVIVAYCLTFGSWRETIVYVALLTCLIILPLIFLLIRGKPSDIGMEPEPDTDLDDSEADAVDPVLSSKQIIFHPSYWFLGLSLGLLVTCFTAIVANIGPFIAQTGGTPAQASMFILVMSVAGIFGKIVFGVMADKINLKYGLWISQFLLIVSLQLLSLEPNFILLAIASVGLGLTTGSMLPVWGSMMARLYGVVSYGRAMGVMMPLVSILAMMGFPLIGILYGISESYQLPFAVFTGITVLSAIMLWPLKLDMLTGQPSQVEA